MRLSWPSPQTKSRLRNAAYDLLERRGWHLTRVHFYSALPEFGKVPEELWAQPSQLPGVDMNDAGQVELTRQLARFRTEYDELAKRAPGEPHQFHFGPENVFIGSPCAEVLYAMVRQVVPRRIVEVGSGFTTYLMAEAVRANQLDHGIDCELTSIDPYPNPAVRAGFPGLARLIQQPVEKVPLDVFEALGDGDLLFIDSTHVLKIGSDVQYEFLEILPRLNVGVVVHVHDIFLPLEYPKDWVYERRRSWTEQYLLQAFLAFNSSFEVLWGGAYLAVHHPEELEAAFPRFYREWTRPSSFWMRRAR